MGGGGNPLLSPTPKIQGWGGLGYGWGSGKSGIWIETFLYIKFFQKESLGQQIPMKIPS